MRGCRALSRSGSTSAVSPGRTGRPRRSCSISGIVARSSAASSACRASALAWLVAAPLWQPLHPPHVRASARTRHHCSLHPMRDRRHPARTGNAGRPGPRRAAFTATCRAALQGWPYRCNGWRRSVARRLCCRHARRLGWSASMAGVTAETGPCAVGRRSGSLASGTIARVYREPRLLLSCDTSRTRERGSRMSPG